MSAFGLQHGAKMAQRMAMKLGCRHIAKGFSREFIEKAIRDFGAVNAEKELQGIAHDIDAQGALLVRVGDAIVRVISGEVRWIS